MSLTTATRTAMFAAIANARMLEDGLSEPEEAWSGVVGYMNYLQNDVSNLKLELESALDSIRTNGENIFNLTDRMNTVEGNVDVLDHQIGDNHASIMDLFGQQVTYDIFFTNEEKIIVPQTPAQYTVHEWTVPAGETLDLGAHFSTHDPSKVAGGFRARLFSSVEGQEERFLAMSRVVDSASKDDSSDTTMLYRAKVEQDTTFSLRLDSFEAEQQIEDHRMQFGYKTYGASYEVAVAPYEGELVFFDGANCDGQEWSEGDASTIPTSKDYTRDMLWNSDGGRMDDALSSVMVPFGMIVEMWQHPGPSGQKTTYEHTGKCQPLGAVMDNQVSYIRVTNPAGPAPQIELPACEIDEALNARGPNQCEQSSECAGERTCSVHGWCQGEAGCL